jgi:hypothetical protein
VLSSSTQKELWILIPWLFLRIYTHWV